MYDGINQDNSVSAFYSGTGSTATVVFSITTSSPLSKNLNIKCTISGTTTTISSTNSISFTVNSCTLTGINAVM